MRFTAIYPASKNFTPTDLMRNHAQLTRGVTFHTDKYFTPYLLFAGTCYYYDHWKIENGSDNAWIAVTVYLKERADASHRSHPVHNRVIS